ncbi:hypothetical protein RIF29_20746 [Crotalaria pallida]|uniref:Zinc finger GRF-type domain-containing protein n=1 Tax=Crotalaria pallida TaxID=3830 RepID=A0AAN9ICQ9_CROPI
MNQAPLFKCEVEAILCNSHTAEHYGWRFWGCRFYEDSGCGFFQWFNDEDEKYRSIRSQRMKIGDLQAALDDTKYELRSALNDVQLKKKELKGMKMELQPRSVFWFLVIAV